MSSQRRSRRRLLTWPERPARPILSSGGSLLYVLVNETKGIIHIVRTSRERFYKSIVDNYSTFANKRRGVAKVLDGLRRTPLRTLDTVSKIWHPLSVGRWTLLPDPPSLPRHRAIFAFDPPAPSVGRMVRHPFALGSKVPKTEGPSQKCWTGCRDPPSHFGHTLKFRTLLPKVLDGQF